MARKVYTDTEREAVRQNRARLVESARDIEENRPADLDRAVAILGGFSRRNVALILIQAEQRGRDIPGAVAGFHEWRKVGRMVRKGSKGYGILVPLMKKKEDGTGESLTGFGFSHVFDVLDTEPISDGAPVRLRDLDGVTVGSN